MTTSSLLPLRTHRSPVASSSSSAPAVRAGVDVPRKPVVWEDLTTGKFHAVNNETGEEVPVDRNGRPIAQFHHGISGVASTHERNSLRLKDVALQKSLLLPEGRRPKLKKEDLAGETAVRVKWPKDEDFDEPDQHLWTVLKPADFNQQVHLGWRFSAACPPLTE